MIATDTVNILVVDDLPEKVLVLRLVLEELGQNVISAHSGQEALRHILEQEFAVILLDVNMPGMDGYETARLIRRRKKSAHTPIIFITAYADEAQTAQGYALGAVDYLLSPIVPDILRSKVNVFVDLFRMTQRVKRQADEQVALAREQAARFAAEETIRRLNFLAEASKGLASSLDFEATVRELLRLVTPRQADLGIVTLVNDRGQLCHTELAWDEPQQGIQVHTLPSFRQLHLNLIDGLQHVLQSGKPEYLPNLRQGQPVLQKNAPGSNPATEAGPAFDLQSLVILPLLARGRVLGILSLGMGHSARRYDSADLALVEELAGRAAIALDNARLYRDIQEADHRKNEFLAMLAHELRNPLAPILNGVQILRLGALARPETQQIEDMIERQVQHMVRIVDDLLDISRITSGKIHLHTEPVPVSAVVSRALEVSRPVLEARRHHFTVKTPAHPLQIRADVIRLAQVLSNLLNNAAKYTEVGGQISLTVEQQGQEVLFRVRDSGLGIPREMLSSVFELFTQVDRTLDRSEGGLGIGLTLVRRLVELHGGSVEAFSAGPNQGSEFVVRLPAWVGSTPNARSEESTHPESVGTRRRVLVVDDNRDAADSLALLLRVFGHEVLTAKDGVEALASMNTFRPEIAVLDIGLPGMNGYEVARRLRKSWDREQLLLVALTGYGQEKDVQLSQQAGFDHHLVKPADPAALTAILATSTQARNGMMGSGDS